MRGRSGAGDRGGAEGHRIRELCRRQRILSEVRLARQITPAVCRVFDVRRGAGSDFFRWTDQGRRSLAALLRGSAGCHRRRSYRHRTQLCAGLAAAQRAGVLHRESEACECPHRQRRIRAHQRFRNRNSETRGGPPFFYGHARLYGARATHPRNDGLETEPTSTRWDSCCMTCCLADTCDPRSKTETRCHSLSL